MVENHQRPRLSLATAAQRLPYDRVGITPGIVHLGVGAFHRAHMAMYIDDLLCDEPTWGIIGASLRRPDTRRALKPQNFLYTLATRGGGETKMRIVGSLLDVVGSWTHRPDLIAAMVAPQTRIVSLTVTEKGYCRDPATGALDVRHADIVHDVANPAEPVSAPGLIVRALELRRASGVKPFTVLCCDNLPANGETTARGIVALASLRSRGLADYIENEVAFPSTMVDRIVPATTDEDRDLVADATGLSDAWPVVAEPFTQWVIEDSFPTGRPPLENAGVQFVADVQPFELMKLRMLNGSHSTLAYLGYLAGYEYVSDAVANPDFTQLAHDMMTGEVMPTLPATLGDLGAYRDALLARFANPALKHRTWQIAMDGSQKLPQRLLNTVRDRLAAGLPFGRLALGVAAWMRYVSGTDEHGQAIEVRDPLAAKLHTCAEEARGSPQALLGKLIAIREIFGDDLAGSQTFRTTVLGHLVSLFERGSLVATRDLNRQPRV